MPMPTFSATRPERSTGGRAAARHRRSHEGIARRAAALAAVVVGASVFAAATSAYAAQGPVSLGTADSFAVLAGSGITNTGPTTITGDVGTFPTPTETGFSSVVLHGTNHFGDATTQGAKDDLTTAYNDAAGRTPATNVAVELGGTTRLAGVYTSPTLGLTGTLSLDAEGKPDAMFIFQAGATLITESNSRVVLLNGANPCNVVWQVGSSATFKTGTIFVGDVLAEASITAQTGADFQGRLLARNGAVTLDTNTITNATCAASSGGTTTTTTIAATPTTSTPPASTTTTTALLTPTTTPPGSTTTTTALLTPTTNPPGSTTTTAALLTPTTTPPGSTTTTAALLTPTTTPPGNTITTTVTATPAASTPAGTTATTAPGPTRYPSATPGPTSSSAVPALPGVPTGAPRTPKDGSSPPSSPPDVPSRPFLPVTGMPIVTLAGTSLALLAGGALALAAGRRTGKGTDLSTRAPSAEERPPS